MWAEIGLSLITTFSGTRAPEQVKSSEAVTCVRTQGLTCSFLTAPYIVNRSDYYRSANGQLRHLQVNQKVYLNHGDCRGNQLGPNLLVTRTMDCPVSFGGSNTQAKAPEMRDPYRFVVHPKDLTRRYWC